MTETAGGCRRRVEPRQRYTFTYLNQYDQYQQNESKGTEVKVKIRYPDQNGSCQ